MYSERNRHLATHTMQQTRHPQPSSRRETRNQNLPRAAQLKYSSPRNQNLPGLSRSVVVAATAVVKVAAVSHDNFLQQAEMDNPTEKEKRINNRKGEMDD